MVFILISCEEVSNSYTNVFYVVLSLVPQFCILPVGVKGRMRFSHQYGLTLQIHHCHILWRKQGC